MAHNIVQPDAMTGDTTNNNEFLAMAAASIYGLPIQDQHILSNTGNPQLQPQPLSTPTVSLPTFTATVIPMTPVPNVIQPTFVQQIPATQQVINHMVRIPSIPSIPIPLSTTEAVQQNLFVQQQQQQQQQMQQQQQQQQMQQLHHIQQQQQQIQQMQQEIQLQQQQQQLQQQQQQIFPLVTLPQQIPAPQPIIHNLIPKHLQQSSLATTPIHGPALILPNNNYVNAVNMILAAQQQLNQACLIPQPPPQLSIPLTVQDRPTVRPVFNGINLAYPGVETLGLDPPLFLVRDFLSHAECDFLIRAADGIWQPAPVVGKGAGELSPSRTSSTCFLAREDLPDYMRKVSALTSKPIGHCELPQVGRYLPTQQYRHHFDAFDLSNEDGRRFAQNGGQRVVTVLVYLNDCTQGGQTDFPAMNLQVTPRKGTAVVFFPATVDGYLDKRALHAALPAIDTKYVSQVWIRQNNYTGSPSKRLVNPMINVSY